MNDTILGIQDEKSARAVLDIFNGLGLPVPEEGEYRERSNGSGPLVLVSQYGFVMRIVPEDKVVNMENHYFIKPLFNRTAGNHRFVIDPGYEQSDACFALLCKIDFLRDLEEKYGLSYYDEKDANFALVPGHPDTPVIIDLDPDVMKTRPLPFLTRTINAIAKLLRIGLEADPQIALYKPLRDILEQAWPQDAPVPDPKGIRDFKELCRGFKDRDLLRADWEDPQHDYEGTWHIARNYDDRLKDYETYCDRHQNPPPLRLTA